tara:strand:+ start:5929 stop:6090 length:162 start_codon:yes stop_codon:yes gene_type:complete
MKNEEIRELKCDLAEARAEVITCGFGVGMAEDQLKDANEDVARINALLKALEK